MHDLTNLMKVRTCCKNVKGTLIDVLLTNKPNSFQKTIVCKTGLSKTLPLKKTVKYRSYKNFNETVLIHELDQKLIQGRFITFTCN